MMPPRAQANTSSGPLTRNMGAAISGRALVWIQPMKRCWSAVRVRDVFIALLLASAHGADFPTAIALDHGGGGGAAVGFGRQQHVVTGMVLGLGDELQRHGIGHVVLETGDL